MNFKKYVLSIISVFVINHSYTQEVPAKYDQHALFTPLFYPSSVNEYRLATGEPGPKYWQNKVNYQINASLDDVKNIISGSVIITYTNNSPMPLPFLWLQLDENLFNKTSRGQAKTPANSRSRYGDVNSTFNGGYTIANVKITKSLNERDLECL